MSRGNLSYVEEKVKKKTPSREKYDKSHPTVSARMPTEERTKLYSLIRSRGQSLPQFLISLADGQEIKTKTLEEAWKAGYQEAKKRYGVPFKCSECGGSIILTSPQAKEAAASYLTRQGWAHVACLKKKNLRS